MSMFCFVHDFHMFWLLGWVRCCLDGWADSVFWVWLGQGCGLTTCWGFPLAGFVGVGLGCVFMHGFVYVFPCVLALGWVKC